MNIYLSKVISTVADSLSRLSVKVYRLGLSDVREAIQAAPYGTDSVPIKDMVAVFASTGEKGKDVIIGYLNKSKVAELGEYRIFSTGSTGQIKVYIHLKNDGTAEFNGTGDFLVKYNELKSGFDQLKDDFNAFLTHVHGGSGSPPAPPVTPSIANISGSKIEWAKVKS